MTDERTTDAAARARAADALYEATRELWQHMNDGCDECEDGGICEDADPIHDRLIAARKAWPKGSVANDVLALTEALEELSACVCGCPLADHENYGEDGISCEVEGHECLHCYPAVAQMFKTLTERVAALERRAVAAEEDWQTSVGDLRAAQATVRTLREVVQARCQFHAKGIPVAAVNGRSVWHSQGVTGFGMPCALTDAERDALAASAALTLAELDAAGVILHPNLRNPAADAQQEGKS